MNTNNLKRFAREARIKLIDQVGRKLEFVLSNADPVFIDTNATQIQSLKNKIQALGKEQVIDTVAYTWFNRLMALRFMDANGYNSPKVVTPVVGKSPEILQNALSGQIDDNLKINRQRLNDLLDGKLVIADAQTEAYKMLLIASCNQWHTAMPFMFERISDYTELLLPDDLLSENSIITDIRNGMSDEDCGQEELIGWLYQFYIADKKDDVFEGLKKNIKITAENIPAATQLFTPRWIVRYMVENTLGKLWLTLKPNSKIRQFMPYYIEAPEGNAPAPLPEGIKGVTDITFLDPCQGSGHVLVYAFDLFTKIYEEEGYNTNEIPALILENNIFGIDIDERAAQLAAFALTMKARSYFPRFLRKPTQPNVIALENVNEETIRQSIKLPITINGTKISEHKELSLNLLTQADNFGSLIQIAPEEIKALQINEGSIWAGQQQKLKTQAQYLSRQYHCVVTNPPYMGDSKLNKYLSEFVNKVFPDSRLDLMTCFIDKGILFLKPGGYLGMINQHSWMFISSYKNLRRKLLDSVAIESMLHLGPRTFPEIGGEVVQSTAFTIRNLKLDQNKTTYYRLVEFDSTEKKMAAFLEAVNSINSNLVFNVNQRNYDAIPNNNICYWFSDKVIDNFKSKKIDDFSISKAGIVSGNDADFLKLWFEISFKYISFNEKAYSAETNAIWVPINKGGGIRKYFGNEEYVINIKNLWIEGRASKSVRRGDPDFYYKEAITWTMVCGTSFSFRYSINNTFATAAPALFFGNEKQTLYALGFLNSKISLIILPGINPTMNLGSGDVSRLPLIINEQNDNVCDLVVENIEISKMDWNLRETSWNFKQNELISIKNNRIADSFNLFKSYWKEKFLLLQKNEVEINKEFISIYDLQDEFNSDVPAKEITILQEESKIVNGDISIEPIPVLLQLVSYSIGCFFGRFCIDKPGLIIANQGETLQDFLKQISSPTFMPDEDNIIPVLDGEWFNDDIVGRFKVFLKAAFGEEHFEENLKYIEDTIGKDIRKYFVKDFYNDHIKRYKKRPIYWMFSSPKGHFKALIYMHRYTPDLCSKMLTDYLQSYTHKLEAAQQNKIAESLREDLPAREKAAATKEADRYSVMIKDCKEYAQTLYAVATKKIAIDLDDGVKVNYQKFKEVLVPIKGLEKEE
jgi:hypothetical protein